MYLLGRYTYTGLQHFLGQAQLLYAMCVERRKRSSKYTYLTILSSPSQTALPINHQRVHCMHFHSYSYIILYKYCPFLRRNRRRRCGTVVRKCCSSSLPASATRRRLGFLRNGSARLKKIKRSLFTMHALTTYHWALIGRSNRCKEGTALNIHCIPMHLAINGFDLVNVYGSAPELKQSSRTWQQKEAKFLAFGL